jgi:tRNA pseudouridine32 synthase/23S rRNA pseudouridine746 synthase
VLSRSDGRALVEAQPETGRTHQLRIHLASGGTPIAGDDLYGAGNAPGADRVLLHAASLRLERPDGSSLHLEAPLPDDVGSVR